MSWKSFCSKNAFVITPNLSRMGPYTGLVVGHAFVNTRVASALTMGGGGTHLRCQNDYGFLDCRPRDALSFDEQLAGGYLAVAADAKDGVWVERGAVKMEIGVVLFSL